VSSASPTSIQPRPEQPILLIVGGPNGSGKSSAYRHAHVEAFGSSFWIINPDLLAARIAIVENVPLHAANVAAVVRIEHWLDASIAAHQTIGVETVLSTGKYRRLVESAKKLNYKVYLIYVMLYSVERNIARVRSRVKGGGHAVPEDKIRDRHAKSLDQMPWFLAESDEALLFDNSGAEPRLVGTKSGDRKWLDTDAPQAMRRAILAADPCWERPLP
jgi:predicted ABC-type ATPase